MRIQTNYIVVVSIRGIREHEGSIGVAIVAHLQSTGSHNQLSWVLFPAIASFMFSLFMMFENDYLWFAYHFNYSCTYVVGRESATQTCGLGIRTGFSGKGQHCTRIYNTHTYTYIYNIHTYTYMYIIHTRIHKCI